VGAQQGRQVSIMAGLATFVAFLDVTIVSLAFPAIEESFPACSRPALSGILNAYNVRGEGQAARRTPLAAALTSR
jgi:hypothetical protein